jgi:hypothetical protein
MGRPRLEIREEVGNLFGFGIGRLRKAADSRPAQTDPILRIEGQLMSLVRIAGILILLLTASCIGMDWLSQGEPSKTGATQEKAPAPETQQAAVPQEKAVATTPAPTAPKQDVPVAVEPVVPPAAPPTTLSTKQSPAKPEAPAAIPATKVPASPAQTVPTPTPKTPPLDLASLEKRLKETEAIGVFTKLTLKNQVDDLLDQFRAYYQGQAKTTLAALRQPYDQLLLKVLSLLQDRDPPLASAIAQSREAIWSILSDPNKFKNI